MIKNRFLWKLYLSYAIVVLFTASVIGLLVLDQRKEILNSKLEDNLKDSASFLSHQGRGFLSSSQTINLSDVQKLAKETQSRITVIDSAGMVLADSEHDPMRMDNHANRPELIQARSQDYGISRRFSSTVKYEMLYVAKALRKNGHLLGFVRVSIPLTAISSELSKLRLALFGGIFLGAFLALLIGLFVAHKITTPINAITEVAEAMRGGDYSQKVRFSHPRDEIGLLGQTFNQLGSEITNRITTLSNEKTQFRAMLTSMIEGVIAVDDEDNILFCNSAARDLLDAPDLGKPGKRIWEFTQLLQIRELVEGAHEQKKTLRRELSFLKAPGRRVLDAQATSFSGGDINGVVVVFHDISELRRLESVRQDFVANASHELKTPLTAIKGYVETLIGGAVFDNKINLKFLRKINTQADLLSDQIQDLLRLARIESGDSKLKLQPVELDSLMTEIVQEHEVSLKTKEIQISERFEKNPVHVFGDAKALAQISHNLIDNAIKYTPTKGQITVRVRKTEKHGILEVEDNGIGIPEKDKSRIFERFYRVDKARSRDAGGTGLGLSIVKHLVQSMDGEILVDSQLNLGTKFTVRLPINA